MRPNLNWEGYADAVRQLNYLVVPGSVEIIRMIASNRFGMTEQQVVDGSRYNPGMIRSWLCELHREGFLTIKTIFTENWASKTEYYQCNWKQIKSINKAISRLP